MQQQQLLPQLLQQQMIFHALGAMNPNALGYLAGNFQNGGQPQPLVQIHANANAQNANLAVAQAAQIREGRIRRFAHMGVAVAGMATAAFAAASGIKMLKGQETTVRREVFVGPHRVYSSKTQIKGKRNSF